MNGLKSLINNSSVFALVRFLGLGGVLLFLGLGAAQAHHSTAVNFTQEIVEIQGVVEQVRFQNPHSSFLIRTLDDQGETKYWLVESDAKSTFESRGVTVEVVPVGSQVTVTGRMGRRPFTMYLREATLENGTRFSSSGLEE